MYNYVAFRIHLRIDAERTAVDIKKRILEYLVYLYKMGVDGKTDIDAIAERDTAEILHRARGHMPLFAEEEEAQRSADFAELAVKQINSKKCIQHDRPKLSNWCS